MTRWRLCGAIFVAAAATIAARDQVLLRVTVHVTSFETGRPIPNAEVTIAEEHSDASLTVRANAQGIAVHSSYLKPARYRLQARAAGYRSMAFGEEPGLGGTLVSVSADSSPIDLTVALHRGSTIAGTVTNDLKEPVIGADVRAMYWRSVGPSWLSAGDIRQLATASTKTDDRGAYRIIGLDAGQYFVSATDGLSVAFATTPRAPAAPRQIAIGVDAEQAGVNIQTKPSPTGTIAGSIAGPGAGAAGISVLLMQDAGAVGFIPVTAARVEPGARFTMADVPVGKYVLIVRPGTIRAWARTPVVIAANSEPTATLALHPGARISGTVEAPGRGSVQIVPLGGAHPEASHASGAPSGAGSFVIQNIAPGRYRWWDGTDPLVTRETVFSAVVNEQDITDLPLEIASDTVIENVRITTMPAARVSGTMLDAAGKPTSRGAVIVASTAPRDWSEATRRIRLARPDTAGRYEISGLPPGPYTVSAVTALAPGQLWDPAFLKTLAKSQQIELSQGQTATVDLRLK